MRPATSLNASSDAAEMEVRVARNRSNNILYRIVGMAEGEIGPKTFFTAALEQPRAKWVQQHFLHQSGAHPSAA